MKILFISIFLILPIKHFSQSESAHSERLSGPNADMFKSISDELICQCGCSLVLSQCGHVNCPSAIPMRKIIEEKVLAGVSRDDILKYFETAYSYNGKPPAGKAVRSEPDAKGFDLLAWIAPFVLLAIFLLVVFKIIKNKSGSSSPITENPVRSPSDAYSVQIEEELKRLN